jgi:predicted RNA methylase
MAGQPRLAVNIAMGSLTQNSDVTLPVALSEADEVNVLDRNYSSGMLVRGLFHKLRRRVFGPPAQILASRRYGVLVFDRPDLDGGGHEFGQDYARALRDIGLSNCSRIFEFCSGPGYIGYSLLAHGFCRSLALADINPVAIEAARMTASYNGLSDRVSVYLSDGLAQIPDSEKWDLVVSNPPHFLEWKGDTRLRCEDKGWEIHRRFYAGVKKFLNPGASVFLQENALGSSPEDFAPMIREAGGRVIQTFPGPDIGPGGRMYYILSRWD